MVRLGHKEEDRRTARDAGVLLLRLTAGGLMAGHGAQKLFGWFGGYGLEGTSGWLESMGMKPGRPWAIAAGGSEFGGGLLTALGLMHPLGPISMLGSMAVAARKVHWGKPIWVTEGGAELPVLNIAVGVALSMVDPGRFSADRAVGLRVPISLSMIAFAAVVLGVLASEATPAPVFEEAADEAGNELQGESEETLLEETM
ncbi:MAG TPA: DoxX family protein [Thermomicrobiales bacterium]|nr:DoxX family protein [Thermomicrobiales bacterium]